MSSSTEVHVKSDLFKDVKYYVTGTIEPEVNDCVFDDTTTNR